MASGDIHTEPHRDGWANKIEGDSGVANTHATKPQAQMKGREMAIRQKVQHLIHKRNGLIGERNTHGVRDSRDPARW